MPRKRSAGFVDIPGEKKLPGESRLLRGSTANKTVTGSTSTPKVNLSQTGTQRLRTRDTLRYGRMVARQSGADLGDLGVKKAGRAVVGKAAGRAAAKAVPYAGTAVTGAELGYAAGRAVRAATTRNVSGASVADVNPRGMQASQVRAAAEKLKRKK